MDPTGERAETLERAGRESWPGRRVAVVVVVCVLLAGALLVADDRVRRGERAALDRCAARIADRAQAAGRRVWAMAGYTRPTLFALAPGEVRDGLYDMVAGEAVGAAAELEPVHRECAGVSVLWTHADLRERRQACLRRVAAYQEMFEQIAADGSRAFTGYGRFPAC